MPQEPAKVAQVDASQTVVEAALSAADRTFGADAALPFDATRPSTGPHDGRKRLAGAFLISIDRIRPDPNQPRRTFDRAEISELAASIKRLGLLQAISVQYLEDRDFYQIIAGERRFAAATEAGVSELPCWVRTPNDDEVLLSQIVENWQRSDMRPFELADALSRLRDEHGLSQRQLATATGKSEGEISKLLSLLDLDADIQKMAREDDSGLLSKRHLYAIGKLRAEDRQPVLSKIQQGRLTVVETEELVERELRPRRGAPVKQFRFQAEGATVTVSFRRRKVSEGEVARVLREVLEGVGE